MTTWTSVRTVITPVSTPTATYSPRRTQASAASTAVRSVTFAFLLCDGYDLVDQLAAELLLELLVGAAPGVDEGLEVRRGDAHPRGLELRQHALLALVALQVHRLAAVGRDLIEHLLQILRDLVPHA